MTDPILLIEHNKRIGHGVQTVCAGEIVASGCRQSCYGPFIGTRVIGCQNCLGSPASLSGLSARYLAQCCLAFLGRQVAVQFQARQQPTQMLAERLVAKCAAHTASAFRADAKARCHVLRRASVLPCRNPQSYLRPRRQATKACHKPTRPNITASAPEAAIMALASAADSPSPLATSGMRDRFPHSANGIPISLASVELAARAAMHGDHLHTSFFCTSAQFWAHSTAVIPAQPHFHGHRHFVALAPWLPSVSRRGLGRASAQNLKGHPSPAAPGSPC